jgi:predicted kinase
LVPHSRWVRLAPPDPWLRRRLAGELRFWRLKGTISNHGEAEDWLRAQHAERGGVLYLPVGVPGSGKSTWVERNLPGATWVSMDVLRERLLGNRADQSRNAEVYRRCRAMLGRALQAAETVVWDAQSHTWAARQSLLQAARAAHAYCIMVYMDVPLAVALERNASRRDRVPEEVIRRSYRLLEEPRPFEAEEIWRVGVDGKTIRCVGDEVG